MANCNRLRQKTIYIQGVRCRHFPLRPINLLFQLVMLQYMLLKPTVATPATDGIWLLDSASVEPNNLAYVLSIISLATLLSDKINIHLCLLGMAFVCQLMLPSERCQNN